MSDKIAYQGHPGANSHLACMQAYTDMEPLSCESFEQAFQAVESGEARLGMIPIENSLGGRVADIHHLLPESKLYIIAEHYQPVVYDLMVVPGAKMEQVKYVQSHIQALAQCRKTIQSLNLKPMAFADTAGAAADIARIGNPEIAAIAPKIASSIYKLDVLKENVEDSEDNTTRFIIMSCENLQPDPGVQCMTSIVFRVRSVPAALYKALGGFATNGVNITKLESYIIDASFTVAQFYAELEGRPEDQSLIYALDELKYFSDEFIILGVYPRDAFRSRG